MRYGFILPGGDARTAADMAAEAEGAGWDGVFVPDCISIETPEFPAGPWHDPWIMMTAMAIKTARVRIGPMISALTRRRPWKLAREAVSVDHLSGGRLILPVGLGAAGDDTGFYRVGEEMDLRLRAGIMDESLAVIDGLWKGQPLSFSGEHYQVDGMTMLPTPIQSPRIPVWVIGVWPRTRSMRRTLRWDGVVVQVSTRSTGLPTPDDIRAINDYVRDHRAEASPFDIVAGGATPGDDRETAIAEVRAYEEAGATWWLDSLWNWGGDQDTVLTRIRQGPPRPG